MMGHEGTRGDTMGHDGTRVLLLFCLNNGRSEMKILDAGRRIRRQSATGTGRAEQSDNTKLTRANERHPNAMHLQSDGRSDSNKMNK